MIKKILIMMIIFLPLSNLHSEWRKVDSLHWTRGGLSIDCADNMNCMVVSNSGAGSWSFVRKTTDGGNTWNLVLADTVKMDDTISWRFKGMRYLSYVTPSFAVTANSYSEITITRDGGETWEAQYFNTSSRFWSSISFYDSLNGVVNSYGDIFITNDGGITWRDTSFYYLQITQMKMIDPQTIYGVGGSTFIKSTDGGKSWEILRIMIENYPTFMRSPNSMYFIDKNKGWLAGYTMLSGSPEKYTQAISFTSDGGNTWEVQLDTTENVRRITGIYFANENEGIAWGELAQIWRTSNGGKTWIRGPEATVGLDKYDLNIFRDSFADMAFPEGHTRKIIAGHYVPSELWLYDEPVSVKEYLTRNANITLYPNPTRDILHIRTDELISRVELSDVLGNVVKTHTSDVLKTSDEFKSSDVYKTSDVLSINVENLPAGMYFLKLYTMSGEVLVEKVVIGF